MSLGLLKTAFQWAKSNSPELLHGLSPKMYNASTTFEQQDTKRALMACSRRACALLRMCPETKDKSAKLVGYLEAVRAFWEEARSMNGERLTSHNADTSFHAAHRLVRMLDEWGNRFKNVKGKKRLSPSVDTIKAAKSYATNARLLMVRTLNFFTEVVKSRWNPQMGPVELPYTFAKRLSQDPLESLFSDIRQGGGGGRASDVAGVVHGNAKAMRRTASRAALGDTFGSTSTKRRRRQEASQKLNVLR